MYGRSFDPETSLQTEVCRYEVLSGPDLGRVVETEHLMRLWDWDGWSRLIADSPFMQTAAYDGSPHRRPADLGLGLENTRLAWHELERITAA